MASQASMKNGTHVPEEEIPLHHGSLLVFDGGRTFHSMLPATQDKNFNPNGFEWRISILFRYTTPAMREFGTRGAVKHGSLEQYEQAKQEYRDRIGWRATQEPSAAPNAPEPQAASAEPVSTDYALTFYAIRHKASGYFVQQGPCFFAGDEDGERNPLTNLRMAHCLSDCDDYPRQEQLINIVKEVSRQTRHRKDHLKPEDFEVVKVCAAYTVTAVPAVRPHEKSTLDRTVTI